LIPEWQFIDFPGSAIQLPAKVHRIASA